MAICVFLLPLTISAQHVLSPVDKDGVVSDVTFYKFKTNSKGEITKMDELDCDFDPIQKCFSCGKAFNNKKGAVPATQIMVSHPDYEPKLVDSKADGKEEEVRLMPISKEDEKEKIVFFANTAESGDTISIFYGKEPKREAPTDRVAVNEDRLLFYEVIKEGVYYFFHGNASASVEVSFDDDAETYFVTEAEQEESMAPDNQEWSCGNTEMFKDDPESEIEMLEKHIEELTQRIEGLREND